MDAITPTDYAKRFAEELPTILAAKQNCPRATEKLVEMTLPLRRALAYRLLPNNSSLHEDALQVGWLGALKALQKWNPEKGVCFTNWCRFDVSWAIRDFKCKMGKAVARPHWIYRKINQLNHYPTENLQELSNLMSCPTDQIEIIQGTRSGDISLTTAEGGTDDTMILTPQLIDHTTPSDELAKGELIGMVLARTQSLSERERYVLDARYGLTEGEPLTHAEIGVALKLTRQRVEQIESESIEKIRSYFEKLETGLSFARNKNSRHSNKRRNFCRRRGSPKKDNVSSEAHFSL